MAGKRKDKICLTCESYLLETAEVEGECLIDEDINSYEYCNGYKRLKHE